MAARPQDLFKSRDENQAIHSVPRPVRSMMAPSNDHHRAQCRNYLRHSSNCLFIFLIGAMHLCCVNRITHAFIPSATRRPFRNVFPFTATTQFSSSYSRGPLPNSPQRSRIKVRSAVDSTSFENPAQNGTVPTRSGFGEHKPRISGDFHDIPLYRTEGLFAVNKPLEWTSNDVVCYIRGILSREAQSRGANPKKPTSSGARKSKNRVMKVGHGGTLDPLATGVLVVGVGNGTKLLDSYLSGVKRYRAQGEFGFETTTLDMEGNVTKRASFDHVTCQSVADILKNFTGKIQQVPPVYSAIRKNGRKLYEEAREGATAEDLGIEAREVEIYRLDLVRCELPMFEIDMDCAGGTYVRSLIRDIGNALGSAATLSRLERCQQGQFTLQDALSKDDWSADAIYSKIDENNRLVKRSY